MRMSRILLNVSKLSHEHFVLMYGAPRFIVANALD